MLDEKSEAEVATADADERWQAWVESPSSGLNRPVIKFRIRRVTAGEDGEGLRIGEVDDWRHVPFETDIAADGSVCAGLAVFKWPDDAADEDSRSILSRPQTLRDHAEQVAGRVREIAARLKLPAEEIDALAIGGAAPRRRQGRSALAERDERPEGRAPLREDVRRGELAAPRGLSP